MSFELDPDIERRIREVAIREKQDVQDFVTSTLLRQLESIDRERKAVREKLLAQEFEQAMSDPLFVADMDESMVSYRHADAETARMLSHG